MTKVMVESAEPRVQERPTPVSAIACFEMRINDMLGKLGEKVEVENLRQNGEQYLADITRYRVRDNRCRWSSEYPVEIVTVRCKDVIYWRKYIDILVSHPSFNY
jgi:hypothetical protein